MTTSIDFDRLVTGWLEGAGPATMRPETLDSALQVVCETPRRTGIRAFLAGPSPWPRRRAIAIDAFPPAVRVAFVAALLAGLLIAGALAVGRRPPEPLPPVRPAVTEPRDSSIATYRGRLSLAAAGGLPIGVESPTVLPDGRVLGFLDNGRTVIWDLDAAEVVDGPRLSVDRYGPDTVLLADGRVLVIGGEVSEGDHGEVAWATAEVVDPVAGTTSPAIPLVEPRWIIATAQLPDGRVLLAGGIGIRTDDQLTSAEVFDPTTMTFTPTGSCSSHAWGTSRSSPTDGSSRPAINTVALPSLRRRSTIRPAGLSWQAIHLIRSSRTLTTRESPWAPARPSSRSREARFSFRVWAARRSTRTAPTV